MKQYNVELNLKNRVKYAILPEKDPLLQRPFVKILSEVNESDNNAFDELPNIDVNIESDDLESLTDESDVIISNIPKNKKKRRF